MATCGDCTYFTSCFNSHEQPNNEDHEICGRYLRHEKEVRMTATDELRRLLDDADTTGERQRDAVEVVRCRDCERFAVDQSDHDYRTGWWCKRWYTDMVKPDGFCAWGERR